jgi:hypothetical protein
MLLWYSHNSLPLFGSFHQISSEKTTLFQFRQNVVVERGRRLVYITDIISPDCSFEDAWLERGLRRRDIGHGHMDVIWVEDDDVDVRGCSSPSTACIALLIEIFQEDI